MKILVGTVLKPQGIKGELKVLCLLDNPEQFKQIKNVFAGQTRMEIKSVRVSSGDVFLTFEGVTDRNAAEAFRGRDIYVPRGEIALSEGKYLIAELIGSEVFLSDGTKLGAVADVLQYGAADVFVVAGEKEVQFPFLKDLVRNIDTAGKRITLDKKRFSEVCLYED